jgi:hypothetical protein
MDLTLENATFKDNVYSWNVPFSNYKIQSISVVSSAKSFHAKYNDSVMQYLESGREDTTCPSIFSGNFSVYFFNYLPYLIITDIESINIELSPV